MRRRILLLSTLLVLLGLTVFGVGNWLLRTTAGTAWLINVVADVVDVQIKAGSLKGQLADELILEEVTVSWPGGHLDAQRIYLDWDFFSLLRTQVKIHSLEVDQPVIWDDSPASPETQVTKDDELSFSSGDLAFLPAWLAVEINHLLVKDFAYQDVEGSVVIADEISGHYLWSQSQIHAPGFSYLSPYVNVRGTFDWGLQKSHLEMTADVHLPETLVDPGLFDDIAVPVEFPGQVVFDGDWNSFSGPVQFGTATEAGVTVWLSADAEGSWQGIRFDNLKGQYLNGRLDGDLDLAWIDSYRMHGKLSGTELNAGALNEEMEGQATLNVSGELLVPYDDRELDASLDGVIHKAHLRGHPVAGKLAIGWLNGSLSELDLDLNSKEARVLVAGKPSEKLVLDLSIPDLQPFHAEISGQLLATGWLRWSDDYLTGEVSGSGEELTWQEYSLASLSFQGKHLDRQNSMEFKLDGQSLLHADQQIDTLQIGLNGTPDSHMLKVQASSIAGELDAQLAGQYRNERWQAQLQKLTGRTPVLGEWALDKPASITWQSQSLTFKDVSLLSQVGERITLDVSQWMSPAESNLTLTWSNLSHDWLAYLYPSQMISGNSSGKFSLNMADQRPVSLEANLTSSAVLQKDLMEVSLSSLTADAKWLEAGMGLEINAESDTGGTVGITASSSQPPHWQWPPADLSVDMHWRDVNMQRINPLLEELDVQVESEGFLLLEIEEGRLLQTTAKAKFDGQLQHKGKPVGFRSALVNLNWDDSGFDCNAEVEGIDEGNLKMGLTSTDSPHFFWPRNGQIDLQINDLKLQELGSLLPDGTSLDGSVRGHSSGYWRDDGEISLDGQAGLSESELLWRNQEGQIDASVQRADIEWHWQGEHLKGSLAFMLGESGEVQGSWQLPLPARLPIEFVRDGDFKADLQGQMRATGLVTFLTPGVLQDLQGLVQSDLRVSGSWETPILSGQLMLSEGNAYLPMTGATLEDLEVMIVLEDDRVRIDRLSLRSGPGSINATGWLDFDRWQLDKYQMSVDGERFQLYNFPELQLLCSPNLSLSGDLENVKLHGSLFIPEMTLLGSSTVPDSLPSADVVVSGAAHDDRKVLPFDADIQVAVELGEQVWVKTAGIKTRLEGGGTVVLDERHHLVTFGEINLLDGLYKAYGSDLEIKQGLLTYAGAPIDDPVLRIVAARDVGQVQAGVQISGTARNPVVNLYSRPAMPERDVLSYIFIGRPMRVDQESEDAMIIGTGAMMPGYGKAFADLGITEIDVQGLFEGDGGVRLRKRLAERWELVSTLGNESGVDLYYILKFD